MNFSKQLKTGAITLGFLLLGTFASAQSSEGKKPNDGKMPSAKELIAKMDKNKDGKLSKKEVEGPIKEDFAKIDTNKDGFLTLKELKKTPKSKGNGSEGKPPRNN